MRYAVIKDGAVTNIISLKRSNASDFPNAVPCGGRPVAIGDGYADGVFTRGNEAVLSDGERLALANQTVAELDSAVIELTYQNVMLETGVNEDAV